MGVMGGIPLRNTLCLFLLIVVSGCLHGCRSPAQSTLPPAALAPPGTPFPPLPQGDLYAEETVVSADVPIEPGDTLEVVIRRGAGEEKYTSLVSEAGTAAISFLEVDVKGLTAAEAEALIQEAFEPYIKDPRVEVRLKKKSLRVKRVFVFGDVKKPGMIPMLRNMTVLQAIAQADSYKETAILDEIRIVRGNLQQPEFLTADLSRLFSDGDMTGNLPLEENDIIYVPRSKLGDVAAAANIVLPIISALIQPFYGALAIDAITRR